MDPVQEIVGLSRLEELAAYWQYQSIKWHMDRGLKLTRAENPCLRHRMSLNKDELECLSPRERK